MARIGIDVDVPPAAVWEVLADPRLYGNWVVGASATRAVEGSWPEVGAVLHHTQMLLIRDSTSVLLSEPERRLVLEARARPLVVARVDVRLEPRDGGTNIVLEEDTVGWIGRLLPRPFTEPALHARNAIAARRLKRLAEIGAHLGEAPAAA